MKNALKIMIVEDEPIIAMELEDRLSRMGYTITASCARGESAYRNIESERPDVVMMDINLQGEKDGIEVATEIDSHFGIPVIYLTAHSDEVTLNRARASGPYGFLLKPFRQQDLRTTIEMAVHKHHKVVELKQQVIIDPLTGLYNRRFLDEALLREFNRAQRNGDPLSVAMLDLDLFKKINDYFGHDAGDQVLKSVAHEISSALRKSDMVFRYGGEEFAFIMPNTSLEAAEARVATICNQIRKMEIPYEDAKLKICLSAGIANATDYVVNPEQLLRAADQALYRAKHSGRDRICISGKN